MEAVAVFIIARLLGPDLYGIYTLTLVFPNLLLIVIDLGIDQAVTRFCASLRAKGQNQQIAKLVRDGLFFKLVIGFIVFGVCFIYAEYLATNFLERPEISVFIRLTSTLIVVRAITTTSFSVFVGLDRMDYNALLTNLQASAKAFLSIFLVILGLNIFGALIGIVVSFFITGVANLALLYFYLYRRLNSENDNRALVVDSWKNSLKILLNYGSPLYISALLLGTIPQLQSIILAPFAPNYDIGNFKASMNFVTLLSTLTLSIATSLFPAFSKFNRNSKAVKKFFGLSIKYASLIVVPSALMVIIVSEEIVQVIYGTSFASASTYLSLHATLFLTIGLGYQIQKSLFNGLGETRETLKMGILQFVLFILLAPYLTGVLGVIGLIASILASNIAATIYGAYLAKSVCKVEFNYKSLVRIYMLALASSLPVFLYTRFFSFPVVLKIVTASAIYLISYLTILPLGHGITRLELRDAERIIEELGPAKPIANLILKYEYAVMRIEKPIHDTSSGI